MAEVDSPLLCGGVYHARTSRGRVRCPPPCDPADSCEDARCRCRSGRGCYGCLRLQLLDPLPARTSHFLALTAQKTFTDASPADTARYPVLMRDLPDVVSASEAPDEVHALRCTLGRQRGSVEDVHDDRRLPHSMRARS